ncbi:MAG: hypothetical protein ACI90V_005670, partial [Bacillariaceae sp.]|jgi:hypothetical protein
VAVFVYTTFIPFTPPAPQANESARMTPCSLGSRPYETRQDKLRHGKEERQDPVEKNTKPWSLSSLLEHKKEKEMKLTKHIVISSSCCCWCWCCSIIIVAKANPIPLSKLYIKSIDRSTMYVRCVQILSERKISMIRYQRELFYNLQWDANGVKEGVVD